MIAPLKHPKVTSVEAFQQCVSGVGDATLRKKFEEAAPAVQQASELYREAAEARSVHALDPMRFRPENAGLGVPLEISTADLSEKLYKRQMAGKRSPGRAVYDRIKLATGICPLCGLGDPETLDHYMPRASFPALSVTPLNLVPACRSCNFVKSSRSPDQETKQTLNPYFDDPTTARWLACEVQETVPATVQYFVARPSGWDDIFVERLRYHFEVFGLAERYATRANNRINGMRQILGEEDGAPARSILLNRLANSAWVSDPTSWEAALFEALAASDWYCSTGFDQPTLRLEA